MNKNKINDLLVNFRHLSDEDKIRFFVDVSLYMNEWIVDYWCDKGFIPVIGKKLKEMVDD